MQALESGASVDGFTVDRLLGRTSDTLLYLCREAASGQAYLLREYAPAGLAARLPGGGISAAGETGSAELAAGVARFLADCARAATLQHAALARSIRSFRASGTAYQLLACPGRCTLGDRLAAGPPLGVEGTARIARALLDGLEYLHAAQFGAGAIAPEQIVLSDAGDAVLVDTRSAQAVRLRCSPDDPYAPLEQVEGHGEHGPWTDIYRLAAVFCHCLANEPPPALVRQAARGAGQPDPLPSWADRSGDSAAEELRTLITRGLQLDPQARPRNVREWRARITTIGPSPEAEVGTTVATARPHWLPVAVAGAVLMALLAGGLYMLSAWRGVESQPAASPARSAMAAVEAERWRQALQVNAVIGYREFIADFPASPRIEQALEFIARFEDQAWPAVLEENSRAGFEAHLEAFPDGRHATEAKARIDAFRQEEARAERLAAERARQDQVAWQEARADGTIAALDGYLAAWPAGAFVDEARALREQLQGDRNDEARFAQAREAHTIAAYRGYVADFPAGRHVEAALQAIDSLTLRPGKAFRDCHDCPEMVVVPAGSFWQGSADASPLAVSLEKPRRRVAIAAPFAVGVREVTMRDWDACVAAGGCETQPSDNGWGRDLRPVMLVSWNDAMQYAGWLSARTGQSYSLPSESEWEYVARAGEESDWPGGRAELVCAYGNIAGAETGFDWRHPDCADRMAVSTAITGSFEPNAFGVYDVIGNVAEWTLDCMNLSYLEAPADGSAWTRGLCSSRMTRGGSWFSGTRDIRLPARFNLKAGDRNDFTGFRVVRRVEPQPES